LIKEALLRLTRGSLIYGIGSILQRFIGLLLLPFFTSVLTPEDYGVLALISLVAVAMNGLLNLGTGNSLGVLYFRELNHAKRPTIIWSNTLLLAVNCLCWTILVYLGAPHLSALIFQTDRYADLIRLSLLGSALMTITDPWLAYLRMEEKAKQYVVLTLIGSMLTIALSIWFVLVMRYGVTGIVLATTLGYGIMFLVTGIVVKRRLHFNIDLNLCIPLLRVGYPSIFGLFAYMLIDYADRQMIQRMLGLNALGVYSIGYSFGMTMMIFVGAFNTAWSPFYISYVNKREEARLIFSRVLTYYLIGFGCLTVLFFYIAKPLLAMLTAAEFHDAYTVVGLVAASYVLKGCYSIVIPGLYFAEKPQVHVQSIIEWIAALINIGLNLLLIPIYGILGAAIATLLCYVMLPVLTYFYSRKYLTIAYDWWRIIKIISSVVLTSFIMYWVPVFFEVRVAYGLLMNSFVLVLFIGFVYRALLVDVERYMIREKIQRIIERYEKN
jgi:O-antigen/teichoic acid export membrane protein